MFDKVCNDNGITHLLTAPYSPTTTGKIEWLHKAIRTEFLTEHDRRHATIAEAQAGLDAWWSKTTPAGRTSPAAAGRRWSGSRLPSAAWSSSTIW
jgi:transposase InsO family protein